MAAITLDAKSGNTGTTGEYIVTEVNRRRNWKVVCTCSASLTWVVKKGAISTRMATSATSTGTEAIFKGDDGPWPNDSGGGLEVSWSGNSGAAAVYIDVIADTKADG